MNVGEAQRRREMESMKAFTQFVTLRFCTPENNNRGERHPISDRTQNT